MAFKEDAVPTGQGKANLSSHLEQAAKTKGISVAELKAQHGVKVGDEPQLPLSMVHIWHAWQDIAQGRGCSGFGVEPISAMEIESWSRQTGTKLDPWEFDAVRKIDNVFRTVLTNRSK